MAHQERRADFEIISRKTVFESEWVRVEEVTFSFGGHRFTRQYCRRVRGVNIGVIVAPVTPQKDLVFIRQIRPVLGLDRGDKELVVNLELPGGGVEVTDKISPDRLDFEASAQRELAEEVGLQAVLVKLFDSGDGDAGFHGEEIVAFAGFDARKISKDKRLPADDENRAIIEIISVPLISAELFFLEQLRQSSRQHNQFVDLKILPIIKETQQVAQRLGII